LEDFGAADENVGRKAAVSPTLQSEITRERAVRTHNSSKAAIWHPTAISKSTSKQFLAKNYLLSEAIIMAGLGAILASVVLFNLPSILSWLTNNPIPPQVRDALRISLPMVAFCVGLCLLTSLVFGLLPAARLVVR
jgi:hypothetical protein